MSTQLLAYASESLLKWGAKNVQNMSHSPGKYNASGASWAESWKTIICKDNFGCGHAIIPGLTDTHTM